MKNKNDLIKLCLDLLDSYLISSIIFNSFIFKTLKKPCMKWQKCLFVCNRGDTIHYWTQTNYDAQLHSSMLTTENDIQCQGKLQTRKLDQAPIPNLGQTLSSYPHQQMVWLCRLQDRDSILSIQFLTPACRWHFALWDVSLRQSMTEVIQLLEY